MHIYGGGATNMFTYLLRTMATRPYTVEGQQICYESDWRHANAYIRSNVCPYTVEGQQICYDVSIYGDGNTRHDDYACMV